MFLFFTEEKYSYLSKWSGMIKRKINSPIKVGVVGYGAAFNMGRQHLREMQNSGMVPTAMAELDPERRKAAAKDFPGMKTYARVSSPHPLSRH
jgi:scyllo-inositol 2-dehydrogenase (NADP+)